MDRKRRPKRELRSPILEAGRQPLLDELEKNTVAAVYAKANRMIHPGDIRNASGPGCQWYEIAPFAGAGLRLDLLHPVGRSRQGADSGRGW